MCDYLCRVGRVSGQGLAVALTTMSCQPECQSSHKLGIEGHRSDG